MRFSLKLFVGRSFGSVSVVFSVWWKVSLEGKQKCSLSTSFGFCLTVRWTDADGSTEASSRLGKGLWKVCIIPICFMERFRLLVLDVSATYKALRSCWLATWRALPRDLCCSEAIHLPHLPSAQAKLVIMRLKYCNKEDFFPQHFPSAFISLGRQWCDFQTCAQA